MTFEQEVAEETEMYRHLPMWHVSSTKFEEESFLQKVAKDTKVLKKKLRALRDLL